MDENHKILFKFFKIDEDLISSLKENYLWFSDPSKFNDPYDLNIDYDFSCDEIIFREYLIKTHSDVNDESLIEKRISEFKLNPEEYFEKVKKIISKHILSNFGVCCFSKCEKNLLMWSHYAFKHTGICLGFKPTNDEKAFNFPINVEYPPEYPKINYFQNKIKKQVSTVQFCLATKSKDWEYEKEIRVIKERDANANYRGKVTFNKSALVEVIFGYKTSNEDKLLIIEIIKKFGYNVEFYEMKLLKYDFGLIKEKKHVC